MCALKSCAGSTYREGGQAYAETLCRYPQRVVYGDVRRGAAAYRTRMPSMLHAAVRDRLDIRGDTFLTIWERPAGHYRARA